MVFGLQACVELSTVKTSKADVTVCSVNEPEVNPDNTPRLGKYYKDFITTVRSVEQ